VIVATERAGTGLAKPGAKRRQAAERVRILNDSKETLVWNRAVGVFIMFHPPGFELNAPKLPRRDL
jgi:hypothetical protein